MLGAIIGDIIGSPYEFTLYNIKTKEFPLFSNRSTFTDDTVHTIAVADAIIKGYGNEENTKELLIDNLHEISRIYPQAGYGQRMFSWIAGRKREPYNSYGNGSAMRVSSVAYVYDSLEEVQKYAKISAEVTHNHPEGIKGAVSVASAIFLARTGSSQEYIKNYIEKEYAYNLSNSLEEIRKDYVHDESCQNSVPQAITSFLLSTDYEDCIRNAVSIGGDSDTIAAIAGSIAEAYFKEIPQEIVDKAKTYLDDFILSKLEEFYAFVEKKK